ncbi:nuclear transport factor 2 family protein [Streptomyces sp. NPDC101149]|uniref:nuclear transport factor 2 family protein n=1 Tax=Streptomyces sp. NPDC101149 TaxID=3366113 RepID=UPI0037FDB733
MKSLYDAFDRGDIPATLRGLSHYVELVSTGPAVIPWSGIRKGHDGAVEFFTALDGSTEFEKYERNDFLAEGDQVLVRGRTAGLVKSTGRRFDTEWVHVYTFADGKVTRFQEFYDTAAILAALPESSRG